MFSFLRLAPRLRGNCAACLMDCERWVTKATDECIFAKSFSGQNHPTPSQGICHPAPNCCGSFICQSDKGRTHAQHHRKLGWRIRSRAGSNLLGASNGAGQLALDRNTSNKQQHQWTACFSLAISICALRDLSQWPLICSPLK